MKRMGKNRVGIPGAFYKVICYVSGSEYKAIAFILENKDYKKDFFEVNGNTCR